MAKLWQRSRTAEGKSQLHEADLAQLRLRTPALISLTGFFTTDDEPGFIAGALKRMEEMMAARPGTPAPVDLYAWSHTSLKNIFNLAAYNLRPQSRASEAGYALASGVIMPLVTQDFVRGKDGSVAGTPLAAEDAKRNLRNITFFGYSAGTILAQECYNAALDMMQKTGFRKDAARDILHEVVLVSAGNISRPSREKDRFTTLYLVASNDRIIRAKNRIWRPLKTLFARYARNLTIKPLSKTSLFVSAAVKKQMWEWRTQAGETWQQKITPLLPSWTLIKSYHELPHYITHDENLSQFAKIAGYALTNATARTERVAPLDLIAPPATVAAQEAAAYRERIRRAVVADNVRV